MGLSLLRHEHVYLAIKEEHEENGYPISALCHLGKVSRAAYYKWLHRGTQAYEAENNRIAEEIEKIHMESPDKVTVVYGMTWSATTASKQTTKESLESAGRKTSNPPSSMLTMDAQGRQPVLSL